ncbi:MAG: sulfur-carrier protein adenylyltransferase/sulfurtransferase, partial [Thermodesulfobacteriota bacterium]|nr:sulfur-carrier protein adenylyltransferase/sulfurtransferase [Thermodesulfobacteriota bacterium]
MRSRAAAQLLSGKGFKDVYTLNGGINAWEGNTSESPAEMGMMLLRGDETPEEIILLAYGMENELGNYYSVMSGKTDDTEAARLFSMLSEIEEKHKEKLFKLYLDLDKMVTDRDAFEAKIESGTMEGGFTTEEFTEKNS